MQALPVDAHAAQIVELLERHRALVVIAAPGAGKSTRIPPLLARAGKTILLQPRRIAARSIAQRIALEQNWTAGEEVGWQVRFERRETSATKLLVATEGILTARLQRDPLASEFRTIVLDEFHERSLHTDLALAFARQAWEARDDLQLVIMSATLDPGPVARFLGNAPVLEIPGRTFPVEVAWAAELELAAALEQEFPRTKGHALVFLPGAREIDAAHERLSRSGIARSAEILRLHGGLSAQEQDRAISRSERRKVILSTNVAETSITIDGVDLVIDSGFHKVLRSDPAAGVDHLVLERIPLDSADQRSGRAGRTAAGRAVRLWDPRQILPLHREAEIARVDLAGPALEIFAWGEDPKDFPWFEPPRDDRIQAANELLERLGLIKNRRITAMGRTAHRLRVHPRIAAFLIRAGAGERAVRIAAALTEGIRVERNETTSASDLFALAERSGTDPRAHRLTRAILRSAREAGVPGGDDSDDAIRKAVPAGWPDRVARRRAEQRDRYLLASGGGAVLARGSSVDSEWLVALDLGAAMVDGVPHGLIRVASSIEREWLEPTHSLRRLEESAAGVTAVEERMYGSIVLERRRVPVSAAEEREWRARHIAASSDPALLQLRRRMAMAGLHADLEALAAETGQISAPDLLSLLPWKLRQQLERLAPEKLRVPSGREVPLEYREDGSVDLKVKLQEVFGLTESPRVGAERVPVTMVLLSPAGRPVQTTRDLRSFWTSGYFEVRKELRGRYPKHPWPEDPTTAKPTARTRRREG